MTGARNRNKLILITILCAFILALITLSYAYFTGAFSGSETTIGSTSGTLELTYTDCVTDSRNNTSCEDISASLSPGDSVVKTFQIKNTGSLGTTYDLYFTEIYNTFTNDELVYTITNIDTGEVLAQETAVTYSETVSLNEVIKENISIEGGETQRYRLTVTFLNTDYDQSDNENAEFKLKLGLLEKTYETLEITDVTLKDSNDANGSIASYRGTTMGSTVSLSTTDGTSTISYYVTLYNATDYTYTYVGIDTANSSFDNDYITYEVTGIEYGDRIEPDSGTMITIKFSYTDDTVASNTTLTSSIIFEFTRAYKITYSGIADTTSLPTLFYLDTPAEDQTIDLGSLDIDDVIIYQDSITLTSGIHYTYIDGILTLSTNITGDIKIVGLSNYCTENGITNLGDCVIALDQNELITTSLESGNTIENAITSAKAKIQSKDTPDFSAIEPSVEYVESISTVTGTNIASVSTYIYYGNGYTFDESTGYYKITNQEYGSPADTITTDSSNKIYTCWSQYGGTCNTIYVVYGYRTTTATSGAITYYITSADKYTYELSSEAVSNSGLYSTLDDYGTSYYYRGVVTNNYVSFAGFIWRIIRVNGDGSVRMIYAGTSTDATGTDTQLTTVAFNTAINDPTYSGYTYSENFVYKEGSSSTTYNYITSTASYLFSDAYDCDDETQTCSLTGSTISGVWSEIYSNVIENYPYTCWTVSAKSCKIMSEVQGYTNATNANVLYRGYISESFGSLTNEIGSTSVDTDSNIKTYVDTWYLTNIQNKQDDNNNSYSLYLSDNLFCSDRSYYNGNSTFSLTSATDFGTRGRIYYNKNPSLICSRQTDQYTVEEDSENNIGNGKLSYPVGLITGDEAAFAGGVSGLNNELYYLYTGAKYWTMSPSYFATTVLHVRNIIVNDSGFIGYGNEITSLCGIRPVINISSDVLISEGNGTADSPYVLKLSNS